MSFYKLLYLLFYDFYTWWLSLTKDVVLNHLLHHVRIYLEDFQREFAVAIFRENLQWEFAAAICPRFFVYVSKPFFCVCRSFLFVNKPFLNESKPFLYVSETILFMRIPLRRVFLFTIAVAVMGHRSFLLLQIFDSLVCAQTFFYSIPKRLRDIYYLCDLPVTKC